MLYLHGTPKDAGRLSLALTEPVSPKGGHWLDHWALHLVAVSDQDDLAAILMNVETKFIMIEVMKEAAFLKEALENFIHRLERFSGYNLHARYQDFQLCEDRVVSDKNLFNSLTYKVVNQANKQDPAGTGFDFEKIECLWNAGIVNRSCPYDLLMSLLQDGVEKPFAETSVPFLKVVK